MGRVHPPKVQPGESLTHGSINDGISEIRGQARNIDGLNFRDESLTSRQLIDDTFIRDFSFWQGNGPCQRLYRYGGDGEVGDTRQGKLQIPHWSTSRVYSKNSTSLLSNNPHVTLSANGNKNDSSVIKVSFSIWMDDFGFQTYRKSQRQRFKGPIVKCFIGSHEAAGSDPEDFGVHPATVQWFQLPWSGARWNSPAEPKVVSGSDALSYLPTFGGIPTGPAIGLDSSYFDGWYKHTAGQRQIVPHQEYDLFDFDASEELSPMTFRYNFHYQGSLVWEPTGGNQTRHFVLLVQTMFDDESRIPVFGATGETGTATASYSWVETDEDDEMVTIEKDTETSYKYVRHACNFPGVYLRNLTMNGVTYAGGR